MILKINGHPIDTLNRATERLEQAAATWDAVVFWVNPVHWWNALGAYIVSPDAWFAVTITTCILIAIWALGAEWPKKAIFWGGLTFWILRGAVFG